jgi:hypothetical protein
VVQVGRVSRRYRNDIAAWLVAASRVSTLSDTARGIRIVIMVPSSSRIQRLSLVAGRCSVLL